MSWQISLNGTQVQMLREQADDKCINKTSHKYFMAYSRFPEVYYSIWGGGGGGGVGQLAIVYEMLTLQLQVHHIIITSYFPYLSAQRSSRPTYNHDDRTFLSP